MVRNSLNIKCILIIAIATIMLKDNTVIRIAYNGVLIVAGHEAFEGGFEVSDEQ